MGEMTDIQLLLIVLIMFITSAFIAHKVSFNAMKRLEQQFRDMAKKYGLEFSAPKPAMMGLLRGNPSLYGKHEDREMSIYCKGYGMDNTRQTDTAVRIQTRGNKGLKFVLSRKSASGKMGQVGRNKAVKLGDEKFDERFILKAEDPEAVADFFTPEIRDLVQKGMNSKSAFVYFDKDAIIEYTEFGLVYTPPKRQHVEQVIDMLFTLTEKLEEA